MNELNDISEGVSLLLQRMKSHPEEFDMEHGKWSDVLINVYHKRYVTSTTTVLGIPPDAWMSPSEAETIWHEYVQLKQKRFHSWVMETLLTGETEKDKHFSVGAFAQGKQRLQGAGDGGMWQTVAVQTSNTSIAQKLKDKINNL